MHATERVLAAVVDALTSSRRDRRVSVAFSGGMDSTVLLEAVRRVAPDLGLPPPRALHIDHGLETEAAAWCRHAARWCGERGIAVEIVPVSIPPRPAGGLEDAAREARYAALSAALSAGELLCVAHHADDQAETVLLNLLRGSGPAGLGAMRARRPLGEGVLLRPLLGLEREVLAECARCWRLVWVSDPGNRRTRHPRNRLRQQVLPVLRALNPAAVATLGRSAALARETAELARTQAAGDLEACAVGAQAVLDRPALRALPAPRRRAALRLWLERHGVVPPGWAHLEEVERQLLHGARDRLPSFTVGNARIAVHRDRVCLLRPPADGNDVQARSWLPGDVLRVAGGRLWGEHRQGEGLRDAGALAVRFRQGGERCRPAGRRHGQTLKRLFQEYRVPPWLRQRVPLLYRDDVLVAVAGVFVCHGHEARGEEPGWQVRWQPDDG